jgi:5-methylcytosine-specific restriction endonuclease McrA
MDSKIDVLAPRHCMREPINEIFDAAQLLSSATDAHLSGDRLSAESLLRAANMPVLRAWIESLIGSKAANPDQWKYHRSREISESPPILKKEQRIKKREPSREERQLIIQRYGRNCVFCGIPVISVQVRKAFNRAYPDAAPWGRTNASRHAAFQCMWMQFDHVLPHSRGGDNSIDNVVVTCGPCNFGRMQYTLEELGLLDPRQRPPQKTDWDGLERMLPVLPHVQSL